MAKAKLKFRKSDQEKLKVAAHFSGVELGKGLVLGENVIVETKWRNPQDLVEMILLISQVSGKEPIEDETATVKETAKKK